DECGEVVSIGSDARAIYPLGKTKVTFTATDSSENRASCQVEVEIVDTTPPSIGCPAEVTVEQTALGGTPRTHASLAAFFGGAATSDICDAAPAVTTD